VNAAGRFGRATVAHDYARVVFWLTKMSGTNVERPTVPRVPRA
jgi:hypothetical protein